MLALLNSLNAHNFHICQLILMIFVSKFIVHRALSDKTYLLLGLLSPLSTMHLPYCVCLYPDTGMSYRVLRVCISLTALTRVTVLFDCLIHRPVIGQHMLPHQKLQPVPSCALTNEHRCLKLE